jgi:hypothetical protein
MCDNFTKAKLELEGTITAYESVGLEGEEVVEEEGRDSDEVVMLCELHDELHQLNRKVDQIVRLLVEIANNTKR